MWKYWWKSSITYDSMQEFFWILPNECSAELRLNSTLNEWNYQLFCKYDILYIFFILIKVLCHIRIFLWFIACLLGNASYTFFVSTSHWEGNLLHLARGNHSFPFSSYYKEVAYDIYQCFPFMAIIGHQKILKVLYWIIHQNVPL